MTLMAVFRFWGIQVPLVWIRGEESGLWGLICDE